MASQSRINAYMERHKISSLFEDLMNKILRDMPEEPMIYLLRAMYKKAGMEIPQMIRYGGLRKSTSELNRAVSPERASKSAQIPSSADVDASRDYERPWATSPTRRTKPKKSEEPSVTRKKPDWNSDKKTKSSTFDELFENSDGAKKEKDVTSSAIRKSTTKQKGGWVTASQGVKAVNAWASLGMDDGDIYSSPANKSTVRNTENAVLSEKELLASECLKPSTRSEVSAAPPNVNSSKRISSSRKMEAMKHKEEYAQMLSEIDKKSDDSGLGLDLRQLSDDDDAIELLENADDLIREGVKNVPETGFKLSRNLRFRENEPRVKVNINVNPLLYSERSWQESVEPFDSFESGKSSPELKGSDEDEFESVSQVTGPRHPVWKIPDTDRDTLELKPAFSKEAPKKSIIQQKPYSEKSLHATTPEKFIDRSVDSADDLSASNKTWTEGVNKVAFDTANLEPQTPKSITSDSTDRGWLIPDSTDVASAHDWNQRVKGGPPRDPRVY
ncbi:unnamed protein product [Lymnaea stagnalis]|uniref:Uncharacterized protein n=1 Tax=Lymnaea stagnalis TaxID=6523 RepID=A0AAV2HII9_LYMST